jgi:3-oxoacyl-[acyl-carrier protein] reductase
MRSAEKVAVVTGASRGIGAAIATRLARDGFAVAVNYAADAGAATSVVAKIEQAGGNAITVKADLAATGGVDQTVRCRR